MRDGLLLCPEGAATLAGLRLAQARGLVRAGERVVLFNCADGHKYPLRCRERVAGPHATDRFRHAVIEAGASAATMRVRFAHRSR